MGTKKVLVTGIGGNVGQGILRNIRKSGFNINIIGTNTIAFSAGNYLCDTTYKVPFAELPDYIPTIQKIVAEEKIDLIIPSTDFEVYELALHADELGSKVAASQTKTASIYLDKYLSFLHHQKNAISFAASHLPSAYKGEFKKCIAKPRKGRGSRGLLFNPSNWSGLTDEEYMIQELHEGEEITTAFYVNKQNKLHGSITLSRSLDGGGATNQCMVYNEHQETIDVILKKMISCANFQGSANLQSIVTKEGNIYPFEVNCRISGTNSIRSNFGFEDVKYTLEEYLYNQAPSQPKIKPGVAVRIIMDIIYPDSASYEQCINNKAGSFIF